MSDDHNRDFLLFRVQDQAFALPARAITEAVAPRAITPLPFVPDYIEGLVNVGEQVLPQVDLRRLLFAGQAGGSRHADELLVVETSRAPCALRVDRVTGRASIAGDAVQAIVGADGESAANTLFDGQFDHDGEAVLLLDPARLGALIVPREVADGRRGLLGRLQQDDHEARQRQELPCVVIRAGTERYAVALDDTLELLDLGPATAIPGTPGVIEGIAIVRDDVLLVLSLSRLLRRGESRADARQVLVIERGETRYGLRVDAVDGIIPFDPATLRPVDDDNSEVAGVLVHEGLVFGLLTPRRLLPDPRHAALLPFVPDSRRHAARTVVETRAVLQVALGDEEYALPLEQVRRIASYTPPERIEHDTGALVSGAVSIDGQIVPVVNLASHLQATTVAAGAWVIVGNARGEWAIAVSEARQILEIPVTAIENIDRREHGFVTAVANVGDRLVSLLTLAPLAGTEQPAAGAVA